MQDYKAFVSSTAKDLLPHRAHVIQELERAGFHVDPMEDWPASADEPKKFSPERWTAVSVILGSSFFLDERLFP